MRTAAVTGTAGWPARATATTRTLARTGRWQRSAREMLRRTRAFSGTRTVTQRLPTSDRRASGARYERPATCTVAAMRTVPRSERPTTTRSAWPATTAGSSLSTLDVGGVTSCSGVAATVNVCVALLPAASVTVTEPVDVPGG